MENEVSRGEFDMLRQVVASNAARMDAIDQGGTRGVSALDVKVTEVVRDLAALQVSVDSRFEGHERQHAQERKDRINGRRWLVGVGVAAVASMAAVFALVFDIWSTVHR